jgi:hypothetical protein
MNAAWQEFLTQQRATIEQGVVRHFGDAAAERLATRDATVLCDLSQFGVLRVSGEEAPSFLQNLLSCDINKVTATQAQPGSLNSAKGRMLATMLVWKSGDDYLLHLANDLTEVIRKKLSMYVLRSKVKISGASDEVVCLGVSGAAAAGVLKQRFGAIPQAALQVQQYEPIVLIRGSETRFQISVPAALAPALWTQLSALARPAGSPCWDWLNIRAGIPVVTAATQEQLVLQMSNLDLLGGVSFKKGCYPGQEIVARMHYLGHLKRRTYLAHIDTDTAPQANDPLFSSDYAEQGSGNILNVAAAPEGGYDVLATLHISSVDSQHPIHHLNANGPELSILPLPYSLTPAN